MSHDPQTLTPATVPPSAVQVDQGTPIDSRRPDGRSDEPSVHATGRPRARRPVPIFVVLVLAAIGAAGLGALGHAATVGTFRGSWEFSRLGGPWLIAGFMGGAVGGWRRGGSGLLLGAFAGAVIVGAGSITYYGLSWWEGVNGARRAAKLGIGWGAAGVGVGGALGLLGAAYSTSLARHRPAHGGRPTAAWLHGAALGTLGGLLIGEAIALLWVWDDTGLRVMAGLEGLGGAALVVAVSLTRSWRFMVAAAIFTVASAAVAPIATTLLRETLRSIGWAGA